MWRKAYVGATVILLALLAVSGSSRFDGPVLLRLSANHGLHAADVLVFLLAAAGLGALGSLGQSTRRR